MREIEGNERQREEERDSERKGQSEREKVILENKGKILYN